MRVTVVPRASSWIYKLVRRLGRPRVESVDIHARSLKRSLKSSTPSNVIGLAASHLPTLKDRCDLRSQIIEMPAPPSLASGRDFEGGNDDAISSLLLSASIAQANPDVVHVSHVFEGFDQVVALPAALARPRGQVLSATLYDLIPLRFPDYYFQNLRFKRWYYQRLSFLHQADLLLSISELSRRDAIDLLGIRPDRIVTIHAGIDRDFKLLRSRDRSWSPSNVRSHAAPRTILYTAGDEYRKNIEGCIKAFASLPASLRDECQLAIVCAIEPSRKRMYLDVAQAQGLTDSDIRFVGFLDQADLIAVYGACDLFIFPSLYEGLGLPVLEAMACGAPVIGSNSSSIGELIARADATFDASNPQDIARKMAEVLGDQDFSNTLRDHGVKRAQKFSWKQTARVARDAFETALQTKRQEGYRAALSGWLPKPRLAMFTPLPPCASGIADYNTEFIPYLAEHFDLDLFVDGYKVSDDRLNAAFRVYHARDFERNATNYHHILYEFGNSEFHVHMLELLQKHPGVVGLHDAFLSGLFSYLEFVLGKKHRLINEMIELHGGQARRIFSPTSGIADPNFTAMIELPCTKGVIDQAIGLISHADFNLELAQQFYPQGWRAPYRIIPQMVRVPEHISLSEKRSIKSTLGFGSDDFVVASFGHIAWTKCTSELVDGFLASALARDRNCRLVLAGKPDRSEYCDDLQNKIKSSGLRDRITITGYLSDAEYRRHLQAADVGVQLRKSSRGGTPKGVLDCLANGVPVVVNDYASYRDYPNDVVFKLGESPSAAEVATALELVHGSERRRAALANNGLDYVRRWHDPTSCAAQYASTIIEFSERHRATTKENYAARLAPHLAGFSDRDLAVQNVTRSFEDIRSVRFSRPRILIDVSYIAKRDEKTGIPRVVRELVRAAYCSTNPSFTAIAVIRAGDQLIEATSWLAREKVLLPAELERERGAPIKFKPNDVLLMLHSSWGDYDQYLPIFARVRSACAMVVTVVYDLLPVTLPAGNIVDGGRPWFEAWLKAAIVNSDGLACISRHVAEELIEYVRSHALCRPGLRLGWWHLGATPPSRSLRVDRFH